MKTNIMAIALVAVLLGAGAWALSSGLGREGAVQGAATKAQIFLDVRTKEEWSQGHVDGAVHFELDRLQQGELPELPKDSAISIYCRSGRRAGEALQILARSGFTGAKNAGGLAELQANGVKICAGQAASCQ